ncbi:MULTISPECIES: TetR/AcrR family transcriptional regulator [Kitasatospora]|uniref:Putative TetR family transcriptional regulator n=1 Tax=Kitasatospora setae (strain ATCC 33774 / DSM 43861 / JCM 3304 / KCC A-0304 / NBRC 14216 / KM-6054) TaxID=452652 RepID=E4N3F0_KITSK|nr:MULTISPECIES: TetR/AcrR family transcriptional regulator [Kitasatospora]BAJ32684.1 putative TetR family transcriptional regulator [Kitasatospora setae KM-6054]
MARPRDAGVDANVLTAARELLREHGYGGFTLDGAATRAGVARTTVYRRWPTKDHLVVAAFGTMFEVAPIEESGDLRTDLVRTLTAIAAGLRHPATRALIAELIAAGTRHPELGLALRGLWAARRTTAATLIDRAADRGELPAEAEPALLLDQLVGPLYYRVLISGDPVDDHYARTLVDSALSAHRPTT